MGQSENAVQVETETGETEFHKKNNLSNLSSSLTSESQDFGIQECLNEKRLEECCLEVRSQPVIYSDFESQNQLNISNDFEKIENAYTKVETSGISGK